MGSNVTPPYANSFMDMLEHVFIYHCKLFEDNCMAWFRFIDDAFGIWVGDRDSLWLFNEYLNQLVPCLKFNMLVLTEMTPFLDTLLYIQDGQIIRDLYRKPTDCNQLLHFSSFHPSGVFKSIPRSQLKRISRITHKYIHREDRLDEMEADSGNVVTLVM